jgi:hypothetical protein
VSASRETNKSEKDDEITLASLRAQEAVKPVITDDDTTSHDDTTTHERRRHLVKPIILGNADNAVAMERERVRTLPSVGSRTRRPGWIWLAVVVCLGGGGVVAWRMSNSRARPRPPSAVPSAASTAPQTPSAETPSVMKLSLDVTIEPTGARVWLDGRPLEKTKGLELELPCPNGFHELRVEAKNHQTLTKRIPCDGRVVMDLALERP